MADDVVKTDNFIEITGLTKDMEPHTIFGDAGAHPEGSKVKRIEFVAGANNDVCVIKQLTASGATICTLASADVELVDRIYFDDDGQFMQPYIDFGDGVYNVGHKIVIELA